MIRQLTIPLLLTALFSCTGNDNGPDVSDINVDVTVKEFHIDFFGMDTTGIEKGLSALQVKYPEFLPIYLDHVLGLEESVYTDGSREFIRQNRFIYTETQKVFNNPTEIRRDFEKAFSYVRYYFPEYRLPQVLTVVGPLNALAQTESGELTPDFMGPGFLALSLQFYLGRDFPVYKEDGFVFNVAPEYRSRRFDRTYLVADAIKLIADDLFPDRSSGLGLIERMIEKGKQWWLLDKLLPYLPDSVKTGFTLPQLAFCREYEGLIWNTIIINEKDLYTKDPAIHQVYLGEAPTTTVMPSSSPGNIGQWVGWQIVKKFAKQNTGLSIKELMSAAPAKIFIEAGYKPK